MFDEFNITPEDITSDETLYDWYQNEIYCEDCGGFTFGINECYFGEEVTN